MLVKQVMLENPQTLYPWQTLADACEVYRRQGVNCAPVLDSDGRVVGILTVFQVLQALQRGASFDTSVGQVMERDIMTIDEDMHFNEVSNLPIDRLVILNRQGRLAGVLTRIDLINKVHSALEATEYKLAVILQSVHNGIIAVDARDDVCHFNAAAEKLTGIPAVKVLGRPAGPLLKQLGLGRVNPGVDAFLGRFTVGDRVLIIRQSPIQKDEEQVQGFVLVLQDISELEDISSQLDSVRNLNKELVGVIQSCYDGIVVIDRQGNIERVNASYGRITGMDSPEEIQGKNVTELASGQHKHLLQIYNEIMSGKPLVNMAVHTEGGEDLIFSGSAVAGEGGQVVRIVVNLRDITELNRFKEEAARASAELKELRARRLADGEIIAESPLMRRAVEQALRVATVDSTVLITGPSGVGKERLARLIHRHSSRADKPFIEINCGAIPEPLLESELFGYEKGAFTGAQREGKLGLLEIANGGTVFLDEIGDMPLNLQVKLLRVLQEQVIYRVGGRRPIKLDIRIIAATNKDLKRLIAEKKFREDLYYRLNVVPINIPPLKERREDILPLVTHFLNRFNARHGTKKRLGMETCRLLEGYSWPGNVRELINLIERLVIMCEEEVIEPHHLPGEFMEALGREGWRPQIMEIVPLQEAREATEKELIRMALEKYHSLRRAGQVLGISHSTLLRKARQYGLAVQNCTGAVQN